MFSGKKVVQPYLVIRQYSQFSEFVGTLPKLPLLLPFLDACSKCYRASEPFGLTVVCLILLVLLDKVQWAEPKGMTRCSRNHECVGNRMFIVVITHMTQIDDWDRWWCRVRQNGKVVLEWAERHQVQIGIDTSKVVHVHVADLKE